jgi:hypothetical protein
MAAPSPGPGGHWHSGPRSWSSRAETEAFRGSAQEPKRPGQRLPAPVTRDACSPAADSQPDSGWACECSANDAPASALATSSAPATSSAASAAAASAGADPAASAAAASAGADPAASAAAVRRPSGTCRTRLGSSAAATTKTTASRATGFWQEGGGASMEFTRWCDCGDKRGLTAGAYARAVPAWDAPRRPGQSTGASRPAAHAARARGRH